MTPRLRAVTFDAADPARQAAFWGAVLGRAVVDDPSGPLLPGSDTQVGLRFAPGDAEREGPNQVHLHLTSTGPTGQQDTVDAAVALGATHLDVGQVAGEGHVVLADPAGDEFCVIEAGNRYLAGCGLLGEVACDGTRAVGLFWAEALGWPLVWDRDEETAIQSPAGGTKVAWGGPPVAARNGRSRQRFELAVHGDDPAREVDRLVRLGATHLRDVAGGVELTDPDGNEFVLTTT